MSGLLEGSTGNYGNRQWCDWWEAKDMLSRLNHCNRRREEREFQIEETFNNVLIRESSIFMVLDIRKP